MSPNNYGLIPVKINTFVHKVAKHRHEYLVKSQGINSSLTTELSDLVLKYGNTSPDVFKQLMVPRIHSWGGPWKWVYIREPIKPVLTSLISKLNRSLSPGFIGNFRQGVNASNVLSAMILTQGFNDKLVFKANHVASNFGYRIVAASTSLHQVVKSR